MALISDAKKLLARVLFHPLVGRAIAAVTRDRIASGQFVIPTDADIITPHTKAQIFWGAYESGEIRMAKRHLRSDLNLVEIGSSIGVLSAHTISCLGAESRVVCVEANPDLIPVLRKTLETNHPDRDVTVVHSAVDYVNAPNTTTFQITEDSNGGMLQRQVAQTRAVPIREVEIPATTLRTLVEEFDLEPYALVSDIEGAETGFIFADSGEFEGCEQILIELHGIEYEGRFYSHDDLAEELARRHSFVCRDKYGAVFFFERPGERPGDQASGPPSN